MNQPRRVGFNCDEDEPVSDPSLLNTVNVTLADKMHNILQDNMYRSVATQSIGSNKGEVSAEAYLRVKTLLMDFIKDFQEKYPEARLDAELEEWYKEEMEWENVWKVRAIAKKLTKEEYKLLEDHIIEQYESGEYD
jgi:hypothetical protein